MNKPRTILCFGDSITESGSGPGGWCEQLEATLEARNPGICRVLVSGFSGHHSGELLDRMGEHVLPHLPATVLISTGINDAYHHAWQRIPRVSLSEFQRNLAEIARIIREHDGTPMFVAGHQLVERGAFAQGNGRPQNENLQPYLAAIRQQAGALEVELVDIPQSAQRLHLAPSSLVGTDGVHLSAEGHAAYARILADALITAFQQRRQIRKPPGCAQGSSGLAA